MNCSAVNCLRWDDTKHLDAKAYLLDSNDTAQFTILCQFAVGILKIVTPISVNINSNSYDWNL